MTRKPALLVTDRVASTVVIAGRRFPAVGLICPPEPGGEDRSEHNRALAAGGGDQSVYVPAENGLLFRVEECRNEKFHGLSLDLNGRTCELVEHNGDAIWLPWSVAIVGGDLVAGRSNCWSWAEPEWVVETIDRIARKPFVEPEGPSCQLVRLDYFNETCDV